LLNTLSTEADVHGAQVREWQTTFVVSHKMQWSALLTAVKNYNSLEKLQDLFFKIETKTKTKCSKPKFHDPRPRQRLIFVLEAPRDQDPGLEDYITGSTLTSPHLLKLL